MKVTHIGAKLSSMFINQVFYQWAKKGLMLYFLVFQMGLIFCFSTSQSNDILSIQIDPKSVLPSGMWK